jgi:small subunit ribosomal protein S4
MKKTIVCRKCRRAGMKLFLKGEKCLGAKCPVAKRAYAPGQHGAMRRRLSEYGLQLREKQKAKQIFLKNEEGFRKIYQLAEKVHGNIGDELLRGLEMHLDNIVYRLGFCSSRRQARQAVTHGHIYLNGKKRSVPSCSLQVNDVISLSPIAAKNKYFQTRKDKLGKVTVPEWLELDAKNFSGKIKTLPTREQMEFLINESSIIEFYSR